MPGAAPYPEPHPPANYGDDREYGWEADEDRTGVLITERPSAAPVARGPPRGYMVGIAAAVGIVLVTVAIGMLFRGSPSWPASVATVQARSGRGHAENPDVQSEPGQVNFACDQGTRQILWVFALLTSGNNPNYATSRPGGGAWSRSRRPRAARWPGH